jgi:N,N'-diacetylchitobiose transport system substrate-binding protein
MDRVVQTNLEGGSAMKRRTIASVGVLAALVVAAASLAGATSGATKANQLTVWLQVDAQSGWPEVVAAANREFERTHPGWTVDVQYQTWGDHLGKFDATLAAGNVPDVIEMGNTEMTKYMAAGAFADLTGVKGSFPNSRSWLSGLAASGSFNGKVYGVPYYAGSRVVTYRSDLFRRAGIKKLPTSLSEFTAAARKLAAKNRAKGFSPVYIAGTDWYFAMSFVYDRGGAIARYKKGKWVGALDSPLAIAGLTAYKQFFLAASRGSKTTDEARPQPYDVYAQGRAASIIGPAWFSCCVGNRHKAATKQFVMPSRTKGRPMPGFLGGSDLAVPVRTDARAEAIDWIRAFTSTTSQRALQAKGNIPNATNLLGNSVNERAAQRSWFIPTAKHWVDVENGNILRTMLARILTGKATVQQAASWASDNIAFTLNRP